MDSSRDAARYPGGGELSTGVEGVARNAGVVAGATLASRVLGLARDVVLANVFARGATDAFFIAFMIPNLLRRLIGEGALTVAFVPVFTGALQSSPEQARSLFNATWTLTVAVALLLTVIGVVAAEPLARLFAAGFADTPGKLELCAELLRWCFPYIVFLSWVAVAMGALNARGHFFSPAIAPVLLNLALIAGALWLRDWFDPPVLALGAAVLIAGALQVVAQVPALRARALVPVPRIALRDPAIRRLLVLMIPAALGASVYQLNLLVVRFLSSFQGEGAVSFLYYADRLMELPLGVFVFALGMASLSSFSHLAKRAEHAALREAFAGTLTLTLALAFPSSVGLILLREHIFESLFAWNPVLFDREAVEGCARALAFYALGLAPIAVARIAVQLCVAHENTRTPAQGAAVGLIANAVFALALIAPLPLETLAGARIAGAVEGWQHLTHVADLGYAGLALATSLAALANAIFVISVARLRYGRLFEPGDFIELAKLLAASLGMAAGVAGLLALWPASEGRLAGLALLVAAIAVGVGVYAALLALVRSRDLAALRRALGRS